MSGHINIYRQKLSLCQDVLVSGNCYCYFNDHRAQWRALCGNNKWICFPFNKQKQKSKFRNFRKLFLKRHFEKQKTDTESCTSSSRLTYDIWLWINVRQQRSRRRQLRERVQRSSSQAWRANNRERRRESSVGASLCYFAALCLSLCLRSLARVCTMRCLAECIFNGIVGVADAHFANWNVYKPGD